MTIVVALKTNAATVIEPSKFSIPSMRIILPIDWQVTTGILLNFHVHSDDVGTCKQTLTTVKFRFLLSVGVDQLQDQFRSV